MYPVCPRLRHTSTDLVYVEIKKRTKDGVLLLVEKEREGELVDRALVKNILGIFIELGEQQAPEMTAGVVAGVCGMTIAGPMRGGERLAERGHK